MQKERKKREVGVTRKQFEERILRRPDNIYNFDTITAILDMYHEEVENAVLNGEKVWAFGLGSFTPKLHSPKSVCVKRIGDEDRRFQPYVSLKFVFGAGLKGKVNEKFRKNIENGFAGLSAVRMCDRRLINTLIKRGLLEGEIEDGEESE